MAENKVTVERVTAETFGLGEGPHWNPKDQSLYFVDIFEQKIYKLDTATKKLTFAHLSNGPVGVAIPVQGSEDKLIAGAGVNLVSVTWDGKTNTTTPKVEVLATVDQGLEGNRWNDGKVDSSGRFWGGTMGPEMNGTFTPEKGSLYSINKTFVPKKEVTPVSISNGIAWNPEETIMYYIDSPTQKVFAFDYDKAKGTIANKKVAFDIKENKLTGLPDGMTSDSQGHLWIALYGGGKVIEVDPKEKKLVRSIDIPAEKVTSVAFGGPTLEDLYVTTRRGLTEAERTKDPQGGAIFVIKNLNARGTAPHLFSM